jgi:hypothetical protein
MSRSKNQELSSWKAVLVQLRRVETTWRGYPLSTVDHNTYTEAILLCAMLLNDLSFQYEGFSTRGFHKKWALDCARVDVDSLAAFLSDSIVAWRQLSFTGDTNPIDISAGFKRQLAMKYPFAMDLLAPIDCAIDIHAVQQTPASFYPVYQFLSFLTHLSLRDIDMSRQLELEYKDNEDRLARLHIPSFVVDEMSAIMEDWFRDFDMRSYDFIPKHGPGGVAELSGDTSLYAKYQLLKPDALLEYVFRKHTGIPASEYVPSNLADVTTRRSSIVFVPKSMKTKRTISKEPATLMYFQKGVDRNVRKYIAHHSYLSERIDLRDQSVQGQAALDASRNGAFATVDLSAASDSITYDLVKRVFRKTALYPFLVATRSRSTCLPSGEVVELTKFAPMGSALCFPIQTLIFASLAECTARYVGHETMRYNSSYRVYGDDIIVPSHHLDDLVVFLNWCGFHINADKTYGGSSKFRESCGVHAYDGVDVTGLKISRSFSATPVSPKSPGVFAGLIALTNSCRERKFQLLRRYLVDKLVNGSTYVPLFSGDSRIGVFSTVPDNYRLKRIEREDYQKQQVLAAAVITCQSKNGPISWDSSRRAFVYDDDPWSGAEDIRYFECLRSTFNRTGDILDPSHLMHARVGSTGTYLSRRWIDDPA